MPITELGASAKVCWLNYAVPGVGKTSLLGTGGRKTLIIRSPLDHVDPLLRLAPAVRPQEWVVTGWDEALEAQEEVRHAPTGRWDWVWLDSGSLFFDQGLDDIWDAVTTEKPHRLKYGPDKPEYGVNMWRLALWIRTMVTDGGFNFGITCHPFVTDYFDDTIKLGPYIQGKNMPPKICGYMNLVTYMEVKEDQSKNEVRVLHARNTGQFYAKDQFEFTGGRGYMVNPTMPKIMTAIDRARGQVKPAMTSGARRPTAPNTGKPEVRRPSTRRRREQAK